MMTVRDAALDLLRGLGMTTVFGNPGSTELPMLRDWPEDFRYVLALHEASALGIAEGYARSTGNAALVNLHTAPGLGNAMGQMVSAWHNRTPLVVTAGQQHRAHIAREPMLKGELVELARPYVKRSHEPRRPEDVPAELLRAYHTAMTAPQGPVFLSVPMDDWDAGPCEPVEITTVSHRHAPDPDALAGAAEILAAAENPAIVVGPGVARSVGSGSAPEDFGSVVTLAERLAAPVFQEGVVALAGFPQRHPLFRGFLPLAQKFVAKTLAPYDAVLVVGTRVFSYYPYLPGPVVEGDTKVVLLTDDPEEANFSPTGLSVVGDTEMSCAGLLDSIPKDPGRTPPTPTEEPEMPEPTRPMSVAFVMEAVGRTLPPDAIVTDESTSSKGMLHSFVKTNSPDAYLSSEAGGLGFCMPAAIGAKLALPDRTVACVIGDGSSIYSIQSLWTAASYGLGVVFVVVNNRGYSILKSFRDLLEMEGVPGLELPGLDHVRIAEGFGASGETVEAPEDLIPAIERAIESADTGKPYLVNAVVGREVPPLI